MVWDNHNPYLTYSSFELFQGGPYYDMLHCLLAAYVCYRPDVGYVQGMSFIAAVLILNMEAPDAFVSFANLLNSPCHMAFFHLNQPLVQHSALALILQINYLLEIFKSSSVQNFIFYVIKCNI